LLDYALRQAHPHNVLISIAGAGGYLLKPTILIVEDDEQFCNLLAEQLEEEGYRILHARDSVEGMEMVRQYHPNLILLDLMMSRMDGWEMSHQMRQFSDVPTGVCTPGLFHSSLLIGRYGH
jgi:CheY-like chemotaxis protein